MSTGADESICLANGLGSWEQLFGSRVGITSEPESWGQPSIDHHILAVRGNRMHAQLISGVYVSSQINTPVDDLLSCEGEPEDAILVDSGILPRLITQARQELPSPDWEQELNEL